MEDDFLEELIQTFIIEFEELMEIYKSSLRNIRRDREIEQAFADLFRVYHTLKGDAGYFPEFAEFAAFTSHYCELLRPLDASVYEDDDLLMQISLNYARLSAALRTLQKGKSLTSMRFKIDT